MAMEMDSGIIFSSPFVVMTLFVELSRVFKNISVFLSEVS